LDEVDVLTSAVPAKVSVLLFSQPVYDETKVVLPGLPTFSENIVTCADVITEKSNEMIKK